MLVLWLNSTVWRLPTSSSIPQLSPEIEEFVEELLTDSHDQNNWLGIIVAGRG